MANTQTQSPIVKDILFILTNYIFDKTSEKNYSRVNRLSLRTEHGPLDIRNELWASVTTSMIGGIQ